MPKPRSITEAIAQELMRTIDDLTEQGHEFVYRGQVIRFAGSDPASTIYAAPRDMSFHFDADLDYRGKRYRIRLTSDIHEQRNGEGRR